MDQHGWKIAALGMVLVAGSGCMSSSEGDWGKDALWPVEGGRVFEAARDAVLDPQTWVPAAGALLIACIDDADHKVSQWATDHTPVFGSEQNAERASNILLGILVQRPQSPSWPPRAEKLHNGPRPRPGDRSWSYPAWL